MSLSGRGVTCFQFLAFRAKFGLRIIFRFGAMPGGGHVSIGEMSKGNCASSNEISGGAMMHANVGGMSYLYLGCSIEVAASDLSFEAATLIASTKSLIDAELATFRGCGTTGKQYIVHDSTLARPRASVIPGFGAETRDNAIIDNRLVHSETQQ